MKKRKKLLKSNSLVVRKMQNVPRVMAKLCFIVTSLRKLKRLVMPLTRVDNRKRVI